MDNQQHIRTRKEGSNPSPRLCSYCNGTGIRMYGDTATWHDHFIAGQAMTLDICNLCWGSKDETHPDKNLFELEERSIYECG